MLHKAGFDSTQTDLLTEKSLLKNQIVYKISKIPSFVCHLGTLGPALVHRTAVFVPNNTCMYYGTHSTLVLLIITHSIIKQ